MNVQRVFVADFFPFLCVTQPFNFTHANLPFRHSFTSFTLRNVNFVLTKVPKSKKVSCAVTFHVLWLDSLFPHYGRTGTNLEVGESAQNFFFFFLSMMEWSISHSICVWPGTTILLSITSMFSLFCFCFAMLMIAFFLHDFVAFHFFCLILLNKQNPYPSHVSIILQNDIYLNKEERHIFIFRLYFDLSI